MATPLTDLQEAFCREYVIDRNASAAYRRACVALAKDVPKAAGVMASKWLKLAKVSERINQLAQESAARVMQEAAKAEHKEATETLQDYVLRTLRTNVERAMQAEPVLDREGKPTGFFTYEGNVANKALELLGKTVGMFKDVQETRDLTFEDALKQLAEEEGPR